MRPWAGNDGFAVQKSHHRALQPDLFLRGVEMVVRHQLAIRREEHLIDEIGRDRLRRARAVAWRQHEPVRVAWGVM